MILKFLTDKRPLVKASINNVEAILLVDTGASTNVVDETKQKKFKFKFGHKAGEIVGLHGEPKPMYVLKNCELLLAETFKYYQFVSADMESSKQSIKKETGYEIDGILGTPSIKAMEMSIDLFNNEIKFGK